MNALGNFKNSIPCIVHNTLYSDIYKNEKQIEINLSLKYESYKCYWTIFNKHFSSYNI